VAGIPTVVEQALHDVMQVIGHTAPPEVTMFSDASGSWGCGAIWDKHWLQWEWEGAWAGQQITVKELAIVAVCAVWGEAWQNKQLLFMCDNMAVLQVISKFSSRDPMIMHLLRCLYYFCIGSLLHRLQCIFATRFSSWFCVPKMCRRSID
jgi:hypothetical protein